MDPYLSPETFQILLFTWIAFALVLVPVQLKITAPYGRHASQQWGVTMPYRWGWILMEIVSPLTFAHFFYHGENEKTPLTWFIFALWMAHYANRGLIYPLRAKMAGKRVPLAIVAFAAFFNLVNGFLNGYWLGTLAAPFPGDWARSPVFLAGCLLFFSGAAINIHADNLLLRLRKPGETGYRIPRGGFFRWVSCPNHFGEIVEWTGFAILCWNLPAASFAIWTVANLAPRALSHHRWYRERFENYPQERKAVVPGVL